MVCNSAAILCAYSRFVMRNLWFECNSRFVIRIHSIGQTIFMNCYELRITNHESRIRAQCSRTLRERCWICLLIWNDKTYCFVNGCKSRTNVNMTRRNQFCRFTGELFISNLHIFTNYKCTSSSQRLFEIFVGLFAGNSQYNIWLI